MSIVTVTRMPVPLSHAAHESAARFAAEQATPAKGKRVYLNTLAVYAVHSYLSWLDIATDLAQSDCWQPGLRAMFDLADLVLPGIGVIECRPILPGAEQLTIPPATEDRIGYVAVQFQEDLNTVELLGFVRATEPMEPEISLSELLPLDSLLDLLYPDEAINNLRQWLEGQFLPKWQPVGELVPSRTRNSKSGSRGTVGGNASLPSEQESENSVSRATTVELRQLGKTVILVVQIIATATDANISNVRLRIYPDQASNYLPRHLRISALDESGVVLLESQPKEDSVWTELELLDCHPGERFSICISIGEHSVTEEFCV